MYMYTYIYICTHMYISRHRQKGERELVSRSSLNSFTVCHRCYNANIRRIQTIAFEREKLFLFFSPMCKSGLHFKPMLVLRKVVSPTSHGTKITLASLAVAPRP